MGSVGKNIKAMDAVAKSIEVASREVETAAEYHRE